MCKCAHCRGTAATLHDVLFLSFHAVQRMRRRRIERSEVLEALGNRETVYVSAEDPSTTVILGRTEQGRRLKVVVNSLDEQHIITVADRGQED